MWPWVSSRCTREHWQFEHLGRLHHLGESAENLLFRVVDILQLGQKRVARCFSPWKSSPVIRIDG